MVVLNMKKFSCKVFRFLKKENKKKITNDENSLNFQSDNFSSVSSPSNCDISTLKDNDLLRNKKLSDPLLQSTSSLQFNNSLNTDSGCNLSRVEEFSNNSNLDFTSSNDDLSNNLSKMLNYLNLQEKEKNFIKPKGNQYVINVSNSKNFLIGSQKTINIGNQEKINPSKSFKECKISDDNLQEMLDCEEKLNEYSISLISLSINDEWKNFTGFLDMNENFFEELQVRNDNKFLIVYDSLQEYINRFPDTSLGFVTSILRKSNQTDAIEKLIQNRKELLNNL